jgi:hypothetical protein
MPVTYKAAAAADTTKGKSSTNHTLGCLNWKEHHIFRCFLFTVDIFYSLRIFNHTYCREKHPFNLKLFFWGALPAINQMLLEVDPKPLGCRCNLGPWGWLLQVAQSTTNMP